MAEILVPRPASTVVTLRDREKGYEILMLKRNVLSDFVGGAYVFPGGAVDDADASAELWARCVGLDDASCSKRLGLEHGGLAYYVACLRELFEEGGLLLACDEDQRAIDIADRVLVDRLNDERVSVNDGSLGFVELLTRENLFLDLRTMAYLAHWVTPVGPPRRYDTRFFVAMAPTGQHADHDNHETVASTWLRPRDALSMHEKGELDLLFPTVKVLRGIADFDTAHEVIEHAKGLSDIPCVEPRLVERDGQIVILLPGDPGYEDAT